MRFYSSSTGRSGGGPFRSALFKVLLLVLLLCPGGAIAEELVIETGQVAVVSGDPFPLSDAARISGDPGLVEQAGAILLDLPPDGVLTRDELLQALISAGIGGVRLRLIMPPELIVSLDESLEGAIRRLAGWRWGLEVEPLGPVPSGRLVSPLSIPPGAASATLRFLDDFGNERAIAVRLHWSKPAVVALVPLERGSVIGVSDVSVREVRVTRSQPLATELDEVVGRKLGRSVLAGEPLQLNHLTQPPMIRRGDSVIITVRKPGFIVEARGEALDAGAEGDSIR
ncbi:MAG: flagellar basal body P-ring formation protein FlgA, partial [Synergistaceae bacterium]|nr:flagellar basal body P-ring formation protein FlgA [Synergistaceae bacterium]